MQTTDNPSPWWRRVPLRERGLLGVTAAALLAHLLWADALPWAAV